MTDNTKTHESADGNVETANSAPYDSGSPIDLNFAINVVTQYIDFQALCDEWNDLVTRCLFDTVFLRHEWFDAAWQWRKADSELSILTIYSNDDLVGICPLILHNRSHRFGHVRCVEFLTIPDTQHCDIITTEELHIVVVQTLVKWLKDMSRYWDICELRYFPEASPTPAEFYRISKQLKQKTFNIPPDHNHYIALNTTWDEFYKKRSRRLKKGNNLVANHLRRAGEIRVEWIQEPNRVLEATHHVNNISAASWKQKTGLTLDKALPGAFVKTLNKHAARNRWLSIWLLYLNNQPIATEYQLIYNGNIYALRADYDESYTKLSPGTYLNWKLLQQLFDSSYNCYYLGRGDNPYKLRWTNTVEPIAGIDMYADTFRGKILYFTNHFARPLLRPLVRFIRKLTFVPQFTKIRKL